MKTPLTDKDLGIPHTGRHDDRFRDVRSKAKTDEKERKGKAKRNKKVKVPKYSIGEEVVLTSGYSKRYYHLAEIVDFVENFGNDFTYYAILRRTTNPEKLDRIGRLITFGESHWWSTEFAVANVKNEKIKWEIDL